jgi:hypothetical protein
MDTPSLPRPDAVKAVCQASHHLVRMSHPSAPPGTATLSRAPAPW